MRVSMKREQGFTLIELMITVAIIGILSATAVTLFQDQQYRAKRTEAMTNLEAIAKMEKTHFGEFGIYPAAIPVPAGIPGQKTNWGPVANAVFGPLGFAAEGSVWYAYDVNSSLGVCACPSGGCFTVAAYSDLDQDGAFSTVAYFHPDAAGVICTTQIFSWPPPIQAGIPMLDQPVAMLPQFGIPADPY